MRAFTLLATSIRSLASMPSVSNAVTDAPLDGWGQFRFGMTLEQAHAVPGFSWRRDINIPVMAIMFSSLRVTSEYGPNTDVALSFNDDKKLYDIRLSPRATQSAANCEKSFLDILSGLDRKYGPFAPGGEKDINWFAQDNFIRGGLLERTSALNLSGSRSKYWHRVILPNTSGVNVEAEAKHSFGSRSIEVLMYQKDGDEKDGKSGCHRTIVFSEKMPTKAQRENQFKLSHVPIGMDWHWAEVDNLGRGFSSGPVQPVFSSGAAENVRLNGGKFTADIKRPAGGHRPTTVHLVGTIANNMISAHVQASDSASDDSPTDLKGGVQTFATDGEPVDTYEIILTGTTRRGSTKIALAAYHRNSPHTPTPEACRRISESVYATRGNVREMTYKGFLQALGCPA